ncbi:MAG: hypothetical protein ACK553_12400 [Planctomycetota bacterium]|jgi:hypothetical protein
MSIAKRTESAAENGRVHGTRLHFELATPADDMQLRQLLRNIRMDGIISVSFRREPSYFAAHGCEGEFVQVMTARDRGTGQIVGMGSRSVRERYISGVPRNIGYLSGLRIHPQYRRGTMLARGYRYLRELDRDRRADFYVTTIAVENRSATNALVGGRAGLPFYKKIGRLNTWIVPKTNRPRSANRVNIRPIGPAEVNPLMTFLEKARRERELLPCYLERDFVFPSNVFAGMREGQLQGMWIDDELVGTLGVWDQRSMKQVVVEAYDWWLRWLRPLYNALAGMSGRVRFPKPGHCLPLVTAALPLAIGQGVKSFGCLVDQAASHLPDDADAIMIGLCDTDPLTESVRCRAIQKYQTDIFLVSWDENCLENAMKSRCVPYLELGAL